MSFFLTVNISVSLHTFIYISLIESNITTFTFFDISIFFIITCLGNCGLKILIFSSLLNAGNDYRLKFVEKSYIDPPLVNEINFRLLPNQHTNKLLLTV